METQAFIPLREQERNALPPLEWLEHQLLSYKDKRDGWKEGSQNYETYDLMVREYVKLIERLTPVLSDSYTKEQVIAMLVKERERGVEIAYAFYHKADEEFKIKKSVGNKLAFIKEEVANECRLVGNAISGCTALSEACGESLESYVRKEFEKQ